MIHRSLIRRAMATAVLAACSAAHAAPFDLSQLSISFVEPTGTVLPTDTIDVYLRFSLAADAPTAFTFDGTAGAPFALGELLPLQAPVYDAQSQTTTYVDFAQYTGANLGTWFGCSSSFTDDDCPSSTTTYAFEWGTLPETLTLDPGASFTYRFGTFTPNGGAAPAGTYTFTYASLAVFVYGTDIEGNSISADFDLANTTGQTFARDVVAVPEPETYAMALAALGLVGFVARRRRVM